MDLSSAKTRSKTVITIGFSAIIVFLMVLLGLWIDTVINNEKILNEISEAQLETRQVSILRNAAYRRALALHRMTIMDDPFDQEEEERLFWELGSKFIETRNEILSKPMPFREKSEWDHVRKTLTKGGRAQTDVLELILNEEIDTANKRLMNEVVPIQDVFVEGVSTILDLKRSGVEKKMAEVTKRNQTTYWLIGLFSFVAVMLFLFTIFVVRRTGKTEEALMDQGKRIRELYEVSSRPGLDLDEQIFAMLKLGSKLFKLEIARVCKINPEAKTNTFIYVRAPEDYGIKMGKVIPLDKSFCNITFTSDEAIALGDIAASEHANSPYHEFSGLESYIATTIFVHGKKYGTVNFSSRHPHAKPFTDTDKDLVNLIGSWVSLALERQISQGELRKAKEHAETANQSKSTFLANMSHELRTPLNAIIGYSELLVEDIKENKQQTLSSDLEKISASGHHLLSLINDILDISKVEAGKMSLSFQETDIHKLITSVVESFKPSLKKNNDELHVQPNTNNYTAFVDPIRLQQTLMNLVGNAIKFTENGKITVETDRQMRQGKLWTTISVKDSGIGISPEVAEKIFQPFQQASKETSIKYGGTGLGLAISHRMCQLMGGDITVVSSKNEGSTFTIWLPDSHADNQFNNNLDEPQIRAVNN